MAALVVLVGLVGLVVLVGLASVTASVGHSSAMVRSRPRADHGYAPDPSHFTMRGRVWWAISRFRSFELGRTRSSAAGVAISSTATLALSGSGRASICEALGGTAPLGTYRSHIR